MTRALAPQRCLLCGDAEAEPVFRYDAPDSYERTAGVAGAGYLREWVSCKSCGFHYSRYSRDPDILDRIYDDAYRDTGTSWRRQSAEDVFKRVIALPPDQSETVARCSAIKGAIARFATGGIHELPQRRPLRLLDVGGATGVFAYMFKDADWEAEIVDPGRQGQFVTGHGVKYHQTRFDSSFRQGTYDLVSMVYMLEHVQDPHAVVRQARAALAGSGLLYIEVPDELAFEKKPADDDIFNSCHLWMFGPASLTRLLAACGFDMLDMRRNRTHRGHYALCVMARPA